MRWYPFSGASWYSNSAVGEAASSLPKVALLTAITLVALFFTSSAAGAASYLSGASPSIQPDRYAYCAPGSGSVCNAGNAAWRIAGVSWSDWGVDSAHGTGILYITQPPPTAAASASVNIAMGNPVSCFGRTIFSTVDFTLAAGATSPAGFGTWAHTVLAPCSLVAGTAGALPTSKDGGACTFDAITSSKGHFKPKGFGFGAFCRLNWTGWGEEVATGTGVFRIHNIQWGAKVALSGLKICPAVGPTYTALTGTIFGKGEKFRGTPFELGSSSPSIVSKRVANRLRRAVSNSKLARHSFKRPFPWRPKSQALCA